jgi:hypothetical protein
VVAPIRPVQIHERRKREQDRQEVRPMRKQQPSAQVVDGATVRG